MGQMDVMLIMDNVFVMKTSKESIVIIVQTTILDFQIAKV